jgi:hypothetical protein
MASPGSRNSTRKSRTPSPRPKSKRTYTRRTGRERIGQRIGKIEKAVGEIKSLVDSHCGDAALKTVRAAAVAAAEEVLEATGVTPTPFVNRNVNASGLGQAVAFNTPLPLETLRPLPTAMTKSRKAKKLASRAAVAAQDFQAVANSMGVNGGTGGIGVNGGTGAVAVAAVPAAAAPSTVRPKSTGPKAWNEFLKKYMSNQAAKGRKLTRLEAMAEAGANYRREYGLPDPKPKKPKTALVGANAVQVAAMEVPAIAKTPRARTKKAVKILAPGSLAAKTPGRLSPSVNLGRLEAALNNGNGSGNRGYANSPVARTPNAAAPATAAVPARTPNAAVPATAAVPFPSPATYGYEDEGVNEGTQTHKVIVDGDEYFMGANGGLFKREGEDMQEWVGYLEPGGEIRYTNSPE